MTLPLNTHTNNYVFGRGQLFLNLYAAGVFEGRRFIGNCPSFNLSVESEIFEHVSSTSGIQTTDLKVTKSTKFSGQIVCDDMQPENMALFLVGSQATLSQVATPVTNEAIVVNKGFHFQLGLTVSNKFGIRDVTSVVVTDVAGTTTYVLNTDYKLDADSGMIYIISGGAITNGQTIHVDYTPTAGSRPYIQSGDSGSLQGEIFFVSDNANGDNRDVRIPLATISPSGEMPFITADDIGAITFDIGPSTLDSATKQIYIVDRRS
jgi:hypothetical protein